MGNQLLGFQTVGTQGVAGIDHVDDLVSQANQRCQLHGAVQLDHLDLTALSGVIGLGHVDELGRHAQPAFGLGHADGTGGHQLALGNLQIQGLVQTLAAVLHQHVLAGHAEIGGAMLNIGRHIGGTHDQQAHILQGGGDDQLATFIRVFGRHNASRRQQRQGVVENPTFGQGDGQHETEILWRVVLVSAWPARRPAFHSMGY